MRLKDKVAVVTGASNGIGPGSVATEMFQKNIATNEKALAAIMSRTPM